MIFMQGKRVGGEGTLIYACILGSFVIQRGGRVSKKCASRREGSGEF